ncbi:MAG: riboflavin synthase [Eubacteriales bacterium]|nr:riboflavin synthase [Eubacteriales bacterium]
MFTGIVEEIGTVNKIRHGRHSAILEICAETVLTDTKVGDSIAVNGICLTVTALRPGAFTADVMHETLTRSALSGLIHGSHVNLERAMPANGRFGGHMVAGHIDDTGKLIRIQKDDTAVWFTIQAKPQIMRYVVEKGSIAIDGISLTIAKIEKDRFSVSAIPHTVRQTILQERKEGDLVNLETDMVGKYVENLLLPSRKQQTNGAITKDFLTKHGF